MRTDMDLITSCKGKLAEFRIKELKDVLNQLGLSKQGKKQDLVDRILAILSDERVYGMWAKKNAVGKHEVAKLVDDTFRKMKVPGAPDLASKGQAASDSSNVRLKEEIEDSYPTDKIRCLCGSSLQADSMIKCEDPRCQVWQHIGCVIIPEKPMEGVLPAPPDIFYCELCRLSRADPFWMTVANPLYPVKLTTTSVPTDGTNPTQSIEKTFQLTRADKDLLLKQELGDLGMWHFPDGTLCAPMNEEVKSRLEAFKHVKQEGVSEGHANLKLGIRKNRNGLWEVSKPEDLHALSSGNRLEKFENNGHNVIPMSSSATGSGRDGDDASVNQDGGGNFDFSTNNGIELDSMSLNIDPTYGFTNHNSTPLANAEVIVLSDSEEENDILISSVYKNNQTDTNGVAFPLPQHGIPDPYPEEPALGTGASSCLGLFNTNDDEFGMPIWSLPPGSQAGPSFQLFGSDADVSDALLDLQHGSINCPTSMNDYSFTLEPAMGSAGPVPESSIDHSNADLNDRLINNPLPFGGDDPPLQLFLPTRPSDALMQPNLRDQPDESEDWVSLRLGGGGTSGQSAAANGVKSQQQLQSKERPMDSLTDTASLLLGMNDNRSGKTSRERSDSPFPRQRRTVKRFYLSIDSDSD
ncbi:hypothetical protein CsSME_00042222 [Camellia sinensis var. sinensis]